MQAGSELPVPGGIQARLRPVPWTMGATRHVTAHCPRQDRGASVGSTCRTPKTDFEKQLCLHVDDTLFQDEIKFTIKCNVALFYLLEVAYRKQVNHIHFWGTAGVRVLTAPSAVPGHQLPRRRGNGDFPEPGARLSPHPRDLCAHWHTWPKPWLEVCGGPSSGGNGIK